MLGGSKEAEEEDKDDDDEDDEEEEDNTRQVRKLLNVLFQGDAAGALFKELSVLISDPGAPRQQLHPDNAYQTICPLYTVFIALQDITTEMGPTVFLPRTNTQQCHEDFNNEVNGESSSRTPDDGSGGNDSFLKSRECSGSGNCCCGGGGGCNVIRAWIFRTALRNSALRTAALGTAIGKPHFHRQIHDLQFHFNLFTFKRFGQSSQGVGCKTFDFWTMKERGERKKALMHNATIEQEYNNTE